MLQRCAALLPLLLFACTSCTDKTPPPTPAPAPAAAAPTPAPPMPPTPTPAANPATRQIATLANGCFWCTEAVLEQVDGVLDVQSGYMGGTLDKPSYQAVCSGLTGHAECVQVTFDPARIAYSDLLDWFFRSHDPTTLNRQGADVGTQYRSAIFYHSPEQRDIALRVINDFEAAKVWDGKIVTELAPFTEFIRAEDYHQNYYANNSNQGYCRVVIAPKVAKLRKVFVDKLKAQPQPAMAVPSPMA